LIPLPDGNVALKNIDGRYGVIKYADILAKKFNVGVLDHEMTERYQSIDQLMEDEWALD